MNINRYEDEEVALKTLFCLKVMIERRNQPERLRETDEGREKWGESDILEAKWRRCYQREEGDWHVQGCWEIKPSEH